MTGSFSLTAMWGQLFLGLVQGAIYASMSLGLAVIFGMMNIANFAHGALHMLGAVMAWILLSTLGVNYWWALLLSPLIVGLIGMVIESVLLRRIAEVDALYGMLLTFGVALVLQGTLLAVYGSTGMQYNPPPALKGSINLGFMFVPIYRIWVILLSLAVCFICWYLIERTKLGSRLRAATENPDLVAGFGINVPLMITITYAMGAALAAFAGVLAAPIVHVTPLMGAEIIIVVFAVVVIGGMGSVKGGIIAGIAVGLLEGLAKTFYPQASTTIAFVFMALVLLVRPAGLFGLPPSTSSTSREAPMAMLAYRSQRYWLMFAIMVAVLIVAPTVVYSGFLMNAMLFALFACAFNLMAGYGRLVSFGHSMFIGTASYISAHSIKVWGFSPELAIISGTSVAAVLGLIAGWLAVRSSGIYFAMITLALAQMMYFFALQLPFTGGEDGIQSVPRGMLFGVIDLAEPTALYGLTLAVFLGGFLFIAMLVRSPFGQVLKATSQHEARARSLGYSTVHYKLAVFILSAALSGLAGSTKAIVSQIATLADMHWTTSGEVLLMTFLGGAGTLFGPVLGAFIVKGMQFYLAPMGVWVGVIQGLIFIVCVLAFRRGIVGEAQAFLSRYKARAMSENRQRAFDAHRARAIAMTPDKFAESRHPAI